MLLEVRAGMSIIYCNQFIGIFLDELLYEAVLIFIVTKCQQMVPLLLIIILLFLVDN